MENNFLFAQLVIHNIEPETCVHQFKLPHHISSAK